jgi:hypothetical protein
MIPVPAAVVTALAPLVRLAIVEAIEEIGKSSAVDRVEYNAARARAEAAAMRRFQAELEAHNARESR